MTELQQVTRVHELAEEIRQLVRLTVEGVVEIGDRLIEARSILKPQGKWLEWLDSEFGWKRSSVYNIIRATEAVRKDDRLLKLRSPSVLYLVSGASEEALERMLDFDVGYIEAKLVIDAHKWADKTKDTIAALRQVDVAEAYKRGNAQVVALARMTAGRVLAELEAAMEGEETRELAVEMHREHGEWLADVTGSDPVENMANAGLTLRERHGEPATGRVTAKMYDKRDMSYLVVWCSGPHTVAEFPRTGSAEADAWRVACMEACLEVVGCEN